MPTATKTPEANERRTWMDLVYRLGLVDEVECDLDRMYCTANTRNEDTANMGSQSRSSMLADGMYATLVYS